MDLQMFFTIVGVFAVVEKLFQIEAWVERLGDKHGW